MALILGTGQRISVGLSPVRYSEKAAGRIVALQGEAALPRCAATAPSIGSETAPKASIKQQRIPHRLEDDRKHNLLQSSTCQSYPISAMRSRSAMSPAGVAGSTSRSASGALLQRSGGGPMRSICTLEPALLLPELNGLVLRGGFIESFLRLLKFDLEPDFLPRALAILERDFPIMQHREHSLRHDIDKPTIVVRPRGFALVVPSYEEELVIDMPVVVRRFIS